MGQQCYVPLSLFHCPARRITISCRVAQQTINKHLQAPLHRVLQWTGLEQVYLLRCTKRTGEFTLQRPTDLWGVVESRKFLGVSSPLCRRTRQVGGQSKTQLVSYIKDVYSKIRSKTTCFGLIWPSSGFFSFHLRFCYINCDVEISHPIIILVCLCIGGYCITLMYIYVYIYIYIFTSM